MADAATPTPTSTPPCILPQRDILDKMKKNANEYIKKIEDKYKIIGSKQGVDKYTYIFKSTNEETVFTIKFGIIQDQYTHYNLRSYTESPNTKPVCNGIFISWLETHIPYQGQGHASKLILYIICLAFIFYEDNPLLFVRLEDATNKFNQTRIIGPIYYKIGFTPEGLIRLNNNHPGYIQGVDSGRVANMAYLLTAIVPKYMPSNTINTNRGPSNMMNTHGGSSKRKTRKSKTKKNKRAL